MLPQPLTGRTDGVGEVFRTNTRAPGTTRPLKFLRTVIFLKIKRDGNEKFLWQDHQN
ncbi:terminase, partial [Klebsiella pneumoniae]